MKQELPKWFEQLHKRYPIVNDHEWRLLDQMSTIKRIKKGEAFLKHGKVARHSAFVISGVFKYAILDESGNEKIIKFGFPNDLLANCESYKKRALSAVSIVALEDALILKINLKRLQPFYEQRNSLLHVNLQLYEELTEQQSEHQYILSLKSPVKRYQYLLERRPMIIQKISLTNIARYLYLSREAVSRARLQLVKLRGSFCD
ncbi:cAMP-binding domain of CRP or a regulatory subunit of cAMP-dependent protein kinases [Mucilaginibacter gossypiicola]|uniref:cAMP-binding domain of CRP or a regulatory subunit of cAMP-dependent protein kinases n=1 Tax=Mucilaginibacter gossypiicola TaxID=551995 RepID=A0A1H8D087_9SPHI|nr:Crp/Fnr family transcriptional regulator [Mucilaginibacter gossypiicola]SEN00680.1 cAMP-binding domain of CRP or a regulatory subunit of cAMP-dependent protein kinases [Mucilaginibacter gossypiicola]